MAEDYTQKARKFAVFFDAKLLNHELELRQCRKELELAQKQKEAAEVTLRRAVRADRVSQESMATLQESFQRPEAAFIGQLPAIREQYLKDRRRTNLRKVIPSKYHGFITEETTPRSVVISILLADLASKRRDWPDYQRVMFRAIGTTRSYFFHRNKEQQFVNDNAEELNGILKDWVLSLKRGNPIDCAQTNRLIELIYDYPHLEHDQKEKLVGFIEIYARKPAESSRYSGASLEAGLDNYAKDNASAVSKFKTTFGADAAGFRKVWNESDIAGARTFYDVFDADVVNVQLPDDATIWDAVEAGAEDQRRAAEAREAALRDPWSDTESQLNSIKEKSTARLERKDQEFLTAQLSGLSGDEDQDQVRTYKLLLNDTLGVTILNENQREHLGKFDAFSSKKDGEDSFQYAMRVEQFWCGSRTEGCLTQRVKDVYATDYGVVGSSLKAKKDSVKPEYTRLKKEGAIAKATKDRAATDLEKKTDTVTEKEEKLDGLITHSFGDLKVALRKLVALALLVFNAAQLVTSYFNKVIFYGSRGKQKTFLTDVLAQLTTEGPDCSGALRMLRDHFYNYSANRDASATTALMMVFSNPSFGLFASKEGVDLKDHVSDIASNEQVNIEQLKAERIGGNHSLLFAKSHRWCGLHTDGSELRKVGHEQVQHQLARLVASAA
jgi:hypothetical protein